MIKIDEVVDAINKVNLSENYLNISPRAYYDYDEKNIFFVEKEEVDEFLRKLDNDLLTEDDVYNNLHYLALVDFDEVRFKRIKVVFFLDEVINTFIDTKKNEDYYEELKNMYFNNIRFASIKKEFLKYDILDDFYDFTFKYLRTLAIEFCIRNEIEYEK